MTDPSQPHLDTSLYADADDIGHLVSPLAMLARFGKHTGISFRNRPQSQVISDAVVDAFTGKGPRFVCISIPQQFGKSALTSIATPLWVLELHALGILPGGLCGLMSYEDSLAQSWSLKIRRTIEAEPDAFTTQLRKDSRAAGFWETSNNGGVLAIGTAGSVQGRSLTFIGLDDITKNYEQAMSPKHQDKIWDNWTSVIYGRLQPWTVVLVTMVRWAPYDFIGRLKSREYEGDPDEWRFIEIPYVCEEEEGDPLGRKVGEPMLRPQADQTIDEAKAEAARIQIASSTYAWATLWQMSPRDAEGTIFPEHAWRVWGGDFSKEHEDERYDLPDEFEVMGFSWDMAFKDERQHDWVVGQFWGAIDEDRYLIDQVRGHWGFTETCNRVVNFAQKWRTKYPKARLVLVEDKANGTAVINQLRSKVGGLVPITPEESKLSRAHACQPLVLGGNVYIPAPSTHPWVRQFTKELSDFRGDGATHDDQVDAMTQILNHWMFFKNEPVTVSSGYDYADLANIDILARSRLGPLR